MLLSKNFIYISEHQLQGTHFNNCFRSMVSQKRTCNIVFNVEFLSMKTLIYPPTVPRKRCLENINQDFGNYKFFLRIVYGFSIVQEPICMYLKSFQSRGHPHIRYAQKSPKLDPPPPRLYEIVRISLDPPFMHTYFLYIHPLQINFYSDSSFCHSKLLGYLLVSEVKFH